MVKILKIIWFYRHEILFIFRELLKIKEEIELDKELKPVIKSMTVAYANKDIDTINNIWNERLRKQETSPNAK